MVVIFLPCASPTGVWHDRWALPSMCTVHDPHMPMPQPYFVPVSLSRSRITQSRGTSGATSTLYDLPLISRLIIEHLRAGCKTCLSEKSENHFNCSGERYCLDGYCRMIKAYHRQRECQGKLR